MNFFLGTQGNLQSVQTPTTGLERARTKYRSTGILTNGGGWARESVSGHNVYNINWDFIRNDAYAKINASLEAGELIHFLDPQAAVSNSLPSYVAQAGEAAHGGYRLVGYSTTSGISEIATLAPSVTTGPRRSVAYTGILSAPRKQIWLPVPTGYTLWLRGITTGESRIALTGVANLVDDSRLAFLTMTPQGATVNDTHPATGGPDGGSYFRRTMVTENTSSPMTMALADTGTSGIPVTGGESYVGSWYARKSAGGGAARMNAQWFDASGTLITTSTNSTVTVDASWARWTQTFTAPSNAVYVVPLLQWSGTAVAGQTLDFAMAQFEVGTVPTEYTDSLLPSYTGGDIPQIFVNSGASQGVYLSISPGSYINLRWLQAMVLPTGQAISWGDWQPGLGHSGCRFDGDPSYTLYSAPQAIDYGALSVTLRETGAWE